MATLQIDIDDEIKMSADKFFDSIGLDTVTAIKIFLKTSIKNFNPPTDIETTLPSDLMEAVQDCLEFRNLYGPFNSAEDALKSMLED